MNKPCALVQPKDYHEEDKMLAEKEVCGRQGERDSFNLQLDRLTKDNMELKAKLAKAIDNAQCEVCEASTQEVSVCLGCYNKTAKCK